MWLDLTRGRRMAGVPLFVCLARLHEPSVYMSAAWLRVKRTIRATFKILIFHLASV
jgi:hypothetical protein